jgi:hypothetical protein
MHSNYQIAPPFRDPRKDGGLNDFGSLSAMSNSVTDNELGELGGLGELDDEDEVDDNGCGECTCTGDVGENNDFGRKPDVGERDPCDLGVVRIGDR